ncbi:MAG TPA: hypothetical protein VMY35_17075 [Phycisphaerae bacterium]|nr:hypothetical protein [Phycisphaerae bacterium]
MTAAGNCAAHFGTGSVVPVLAAPRVAVSLDGQPAPRVMLQTVRSEMGAAPRAAFSVGFGRSAREGADVRLEAAAPEIRPGRLVRASLLRGGVLPGADRADLVLFEGCIREVETQFGPDDEALRFEAEDLAADVLRRRVGGQRIETAGGDAEPAEGLDLEFNPGGRSNASGALYDPGDGDPYMIFAPTSPGGAVAWTLNEAVAHLLAEFASWDGWHLPSCAWVRQALEPVPLRDVSLEGQTLGEALEALLEPVGGRLVVEVEPGPLGVSRFLRLWLPDRAIRVWLAHQPVGGTFHPTGTHFSGLAAKMQFAESPRRYVARGDRKVFESTFALVAGWDDAQASYDPDEFSPSANPEFDGVRDVFRKWVLNEAGEYSGEPYNRGPSPDFGALFEGEPYVRRHRRFLPSLSRDGLGRSRGVYIEILLDAGATWQRLHLAARILEGEAGLYLTDDPLPPDYIRAVMGGYVQIRVTAAIESDTRLVAERVAGDGGDGGDLPGRTRFLSVPTGYRYRKRSAASRFQGDPADEADDSARLQELVDAAFEADRRCPSPGRIRVPYLAFGRRVGDCLAGIRGRRLELARRHTGYETDPAICRVTLQFTPVPETELELD